MHSFKIYLTRHVPREERGEFFFEHSGCSITHYNGSDRIMTVSSIHFKETKDTLRDRIHPDYLDDVRSIDETFGR